MAEQDTNDWGQQYVQEQIRLQNEAMARAAGVETPAPASTTPSPTTPAIAAEERAPNPLEWFNARVMRTFSGDDDIAVKFAESLDATPEELTRLNDALDVAAFVIPARPEDIARVEEVMMGIASTKSADQILDAFKAADPSTEAVVDAIKNDPELAGVKDAVHNLVTNDPTALTGLQKLVGAGSSVGQNDVLESLKDPQTRNIFIQLMNKTAERDDLHFGDMAEAIDAGVSLNKDRANEEKQRRYRDALGRYDIADPRMALLDMDINQMLGLFMEFLDNPAAALQKLPAMLGIEFEGPVQQEKYNEFTRGVAALVPPGMGDMVKHYGPKGQQYWNDVTGETDRMNAAQAEQTETPAPQTQTAPEQTAEAEAPEVGDSASIDQEAASRFADGASVTKVASLPVSVGGPSFLTGGTFNTAALGVVPADRMAEFGNEMVRTQANRTVGFDMVG